MFGLIDMGYTPLLPKAFNVGVPFGSMERLKKILYAREQRAVFVLIRYDQHFVVLGKAPDAKMCTYCDTWPYNWKDRIEERRGIFHHCEDFEEIEAVLAIMHIEK